MPPGASYGRVMRARSRTIAHAVTGASYTFPSMPISRRHFGSVRKLPSGRYQPSYHQLGQRHTAPTTFGAKADALAWLAAVETEIVRREWLDPGAGTITFGHYAASWSDEALARQGLNRPQATVTQHASTRPRTY